MKNVIYVAGQRYDRIAILEIDKTNRALTRCLHCRLFGALPGRGSQLMLPHLAIVDLESEENATHANRVNPEINRLASQLFNDVHLLLL